MLQQASMTIATKLEMALAQARHDSAAIALQSSQVGAAPHCTALHASECCKQYGPKQNTASRCRQDTSGLPWDAVCFV
jgi:hypothetical protein